MLDVPTAKDHLLSVLRSASRGGLLLLAVLLFSTYMEAQEPPGLLIDLTTPPPQGQQGLGAPGFGSSWIEGKTGDEHKFHLPLRVAILRAWISRSGDFILQVGLENAGPVALDLPISRNFSDVERTFGSFRREMSFAISPVPADSRASEIVAAVTGSHAVPHSLLRLDPERSIRVLLRVDARWVRDSLPKGETALRIRVTCGAWALANNRFFIESTAEDAISGNIAVLGFKGGRPTVTVSGP